MKWLQIILLLTLISCGKNPVVRNSETEESGTTAGNPSTSYRIQPFTVAGSAIEKVKICINKIVINGQESLINQEFEIDQSPVVVFSQLQNSETSGVINLLLDNTCGSNFSIEAEGISILRSVNIPFTKTSQNTGNQINLTPEEVSSIFSNSVISNLSGTY